MPPKKKVKKSQIQEKIIPNDAQWCLDKGEDLTFKKFVERWDCLDRNQAQQRFGRILNEFFKSKSDLNNKIQTEYKGWISSAEYIRFWNARSDSIILLKAGQGSAELISDMTDQRIESLRSNTASSSTQAAYHASDSYSFSNAANPSCSSAPTSSNIFSSPTVSVASCSPNVPISLTNFTLHEMHNHLTNIRKNFINEEEINNHPYIFKKVNISRLFNKYQIAVSNFIEKHKCLPVESYVHELASLTHIFFLCKNQHSAIAEKIFSLDLLKELASSPELETIDDNLCFPMDHFMTITTAITNLTLEKIKEKK